MTPTRIPGLDAVAPVCLLTASGTNQFGRSYVHISLRDTGSGLHRLTSPHL